MKKFLSVCLALALVLSMTACGCKHESESRTLVHVDTANLTAKWEMTCTQCGEVLETQDTATGLAPADGTMHLSPDEWYACLSTNIQLLGAGQTLVPYDAESEDNALLHGVVSMSGMLAVYSFWDKDGNVVTVDQKDSRNLTHAMQIDGQFTNDTATDFFMLLMITVINNNQELQPEDASSLCSQIMSGNAASDNGYTYQMQIVSVEDHTVRVTITAE